MLFGPEKVANRCEAWLSEALKGFAHLPSKGSSREDLAASLNCRWVVEMEEVPAVEPKQRYDELQAIMTAICSV